MRSIEKTGKKTEDAINAGLKELGCDLADVTIDILDAGSPGLFGMFGRLAKVRLTVKEADPDLDFEMPTFSLNAQKTKTVRKSDTARKARPQSTREPKGGRNRRRGREERNDRSAREAGKARKERKGGVPATRREKRKARTGRAPRKGRTPRATARGRSL